MKRFLINITLFFAIVAVCDLCFGLACDYMQAHPKGGEIKQFNDLMVHDCHDVLVLGSSRAYHHYDPDVLEQELGLDSYNAGFDGNGVVLAYPVLCNILKHCKPRIVIYEVTAGFDILKNALDDNDTRYIARLKPYYRIPEVGEVVKSVSKKSYVQLHSGLFRYNSEWLTVVSNFFRTSRRIEYKGYKPLQGICQPSLSVTSPLAYEYDEVKLHWLQELADLKQERGINIVWVMSPVFDDANDRYDTYQVAKDIASNCGIPFLDHYHDPAFVGRTEFFKDATHLNQSGAARFSYLLSQEILPLLY